MQIKHQIRSPLYRNALFLMADTAVGTALGFFFWMVAATFYTEDEVGLAAAAVSAVSLLALLSRLGLGFALVRFLPHAEKPVEMINSCFTLIGTVALAVAGIFIAGLDLWSPALGFIRENVTYILVFVLLVLGLALSQTMDFVFVARRRAEFALTKNTVFSLLKIPLPILLVPFFRTFGLVSSWGIAIGITLAISVFIFMPRAQDRYKVAPKMSLGIFKGIWGFSSGNYFAALFGAAPALILPIMVVNLLGTEQNAYFYVAWMIAAVIVGIPMGMSRSLFAEGSHLEDDLAVNVRRSLKFIFRLLIPVIILLLLIGKWLLLLFGVGYADNALELLWILGASSLFVGVNRVYMTILRVQGRMTELVAINGFATLALLLGSYLVMPVTGIIGIGYVTVAARATVSLYAAFAMGSSYRKNWA